MDLKGKVVFITGSAQGVGKAVAEATLKKGAKVCLADYDLSAGQETFAEFKSTYGEDNVMFSLCDVSNQEKFESTFQEAVRRFGRINIMINNAGIVHEKQFERCINVNFTGVVRGTMLALEHMRTDKGGEGGIIINTASTAGLGPAYWIPVYAGTKSAVINYTVSWAKNPSILAAGVKLVVVSPSGVATPMFSKLSDEQLYDKDKFLRVAKETGYCDMSVVCDAFIKAIESPDSNGRVYVITAKQGISVVKSTIVPDEESAP